MINIEFASYLSQQVDLRGGGEGGELRAGRVGVECPQQLLTPQALLFPQNVLL